MTFFIASQNNKLAAEDSLGEDRLAARLSIPHLAVSFHGALHQHGGTDLRLDPDSRDGYDGASHFNRDCKRHFGAPPMRDVEQLREPSGTSNIY